jgi:hypothetical protein
LLAAAFAAGCGDDEPATTTQAQVETATTSDGSTVPSTPEQGDQQGGDDPEDGSEAGGEPAAPEAEAAGGNQPMPEEIRDSAERQQEVVDQIRAAAEQAREGDPEALEELRRQLKPSAEQRRQIKRWLRERCGEPDPPPICERLDEDRGS